MLVYSIFYDTKTRSQERITAHKLRQDVIMEIIDAHAHIYPEKIAAKATDTIGSFYDIKMEMPAGTAEQLLEDGNSTHAQLPTTIIVILIFVILFPIVVYRHVLNELHALNYMSFPLILIHEFYYQVLLF